MAEDKTPEPFTLAWRLGRISQGDAYLVMAAQTLEGGKEDTTDAEYAIINQLAQTAVMMAQACYMAANIRHTAPKPPDLITRYTAALYDKE